MPLAQRPHGALVRPEGDDGDRLVVRPPDERPAVECPVEIPTAHAAVTPGRPDQHHVARLVRRPFEVRVRVRDRDLQVLR